VVEGSTRLEPGDRIDVHVAADDLLLFDPETGLRLDA
jgi:hypothetical protein